MSETSARPQATRIAALQGASSPHIQALLADFAGRLTQRGCRVVGVVEVAAAEHSGACRHLMLRDLATGSDISISQDLGPGSSACNLDPGGLADACGRIERAISNGADLVILSKFGKQEAARGGLADAFRAATSAGLPVLTAVSPAMSQAWQRFAGSLFEFVPAHPASLDAWWSRTRAGQP